MEKSKFKGILMANLTDNAEYLIKCRLWVRLIGLMQANGIETEGAKIDVDLSELKINLNRDQVWKLFCMNDIPEYEIFCLDHNSKISHLKRVGEIRGHPKINMFVKVNSPDSIIYASIF